MRKMLHLPILALTSSALTLSSAFAYCSVKTETIPLSNNQSFESNSSSVWPYDDTGSAVFTNYNPKYIFYLDNSQKKFVQQDDHFVATYNFGINVDYINAAMYAQVVGINNSNPDLPIGIDDDGIEIPSLSNIQNISSNFASVFPNSGNLYFNTRNVESNLSSDQTAFNNFITLIHDSLLDGTIFIAPLESSANDPYHCFNMNMMDSSGRGFVINDTSNSTSEEAFWPNTRNIEQICKNAMYNVGEEFKSWSNPTELYTCFENYINNLKNNGPLKWYEIYHKTGIGQYQAKTTQPAFSYLGINKEGRTSIYEQVKTLLFTNLKTDVAIKFSYDLSDFEDLIEEGRLLEPKPVTTLAIQTLLKDRESTSIPILKLEALDVSDTIQIEASSLSAKITLQPAEGLHYFSPWYTDFIVYNTESSLTDEAQKNAWRSQRKKDPQYIFPYQLVNSEQPIMRTETGVISDLKMNCTFESGSSQQIHTPKIDEPLNPEYVFEEDHEPMGKRIIIKGDNGKACCVIKPENESDWAATVLDKTIYFNMSSLTSFLYSRTPTEFAEFFNQTGSLDSRIYALAEDGKKIEDPSDPTGFKVINKMFGTIQCYKCNESGAETTEKIPGKYFFIDVVDVSDVPIQLRNKLNADIEANPTCYTCTITGDDCVSLHYQVPDFKKEETTRYSVYCTNIKELVTTFTVSKTNNYTQQSPTFFYNAITTFKSLYIGYNDQKKSKTPLFEIDLPRDSVVGVQKPTIIDSHLIPNPDPETYRRMTDLCSLWPVVVSPQGDILSSPDTAGLEAPVEGINKLKMNCNVLFRKPNHIVNNTDLFYFVAPEIITVQKEYNWVDYRIEPETKTEDYTWKIVSDTGTNSKITPEGVFTAGDKSSTGGEVVVQATAVDGSFGQQILTIDSLSSKKYFSKKSNASTKVVIIGQTEFIPGQVATLKAYKPAILQHAGDQYTFKVHFGDSFLPTATSRYYSHLTFNFSSTIVKQNPDISSPDKLWGSDDGTITPSIKVTINGKPATKTEAFEINKDSQDTEITIELVKEFLNVNNLEFQIGNIILEDGSIAASEVYPLSIYGVQNPISQEPDEWVLNEEKRYDPKTGEIDNEHCFKYQGDSVLSIYESDNLYRDHCLSPENLTFSVIQTGSNPFKLFPIIEKDEESDIHWIIKLYEFQPTEGSLPPLWFTVDFYQDQIVDQNSTYWITSLLITQNIEFDPMIYGKLNMSYTQGVIASELTSSWAIGVPEQEPQPGPSPVIDPTEPVQTWFTTNHIIGLSIIGASIASIILSSLAIKKYNKKKNKV